MAHEKGTGKDCAMVKAMAKWHRNRSHTLISHRDMNIMMEKRGAPRVGAAVFIWPFVMNGGLIFMVAS
jgi:hypothetical protein